MPGLYRGAPEEFSIADADVPADAQRFALVRPVTSEYFQALAIPQLAGETCRLDPQSQTRTAIVNRRLVEIAPITDVLAGSLAAPRFHASLVGLFAAIAILLATVGLYRGLSYTVSRRTHEIGVRLALGAQPGRVTRDVILSALANAADGVGLGVASALMFAPAMPA